MKIQNIFIEKVIQLENYISVLTQQDSAPEMFDPELIHLVIGKVAVCKNLVFYFKDGTVVSI